VVIDMPKSIRAVVAIVAAQLAGAIYVPFDPETPPERRQKMLGSLGQHRVLQCTIAGYQLDGRNLDTLHPGGEKPDDAERELFAAQASRSSHDPLYVMFTSGTTGTPKGVTIANISVIDFVDWVAETYEIGADEVIASQTPLYFDMSVLDLYLCFSRACTLHLVPADHFRFPGSLVDYLERHQVTLIFFVPTVLSHLASLDLLGEFDGSRLRKVLFAGESMPLATLRYLRERLPDALLSNLYGPTEVTVIAAYHIFEDSLERFEKTPIGRPCENKTIVLLDDDGVPLTGADRTGELCVGGLGVSLGYWNDPKATSASFIQNPAHSLYRNVLYRTGDLAYRSSRDGLLYLVGRKDDQFKHLGHRIEPGEIENAIVRGGEVVQCCVCYDHERREIVAFIAGAKLPDHEALREGLRAVLPAYMIPRKFLGLESFPLAPNGKVDREALWRAYVDGGG
jgi:amino acid adenylation domain-containing protein